MPRLAVPPAVLLLLASATTAAPPTITALTPRGAERGQPTEVLLAGTNLSPQTRLLLPFKADAVLVPDAKPSPAAVRFRITADAGVVPGVYPVRVVTEDGVSPAALFCVDALPNTAEVEDNNTPEKAQRLAAPVVVTGQCAAGDVDFYRCALRKGQRLVVETETARLGSAVVPQLRVTDSRLRFVAADDTQAAAGEGRVAFVAGADDEYRIEFSDSRYRGGNPAHYRLKLGDYDFVGEVFPLGGRRGESVEFLLRGGSLAGEWRLRRTLNEDVLPLEGVLRPGTTFSRVAVGDFPERLWVKNAGTEPRAMDLLPPLTVNSRLEHPGDADRFQVTVTPGLRYRFSVQAESLGSSLDAVLTLRDPAGRQLAQADDADIPPPAPGLPPSRSADPSLDFTAPAEVTLLLLEVRDRLKGGGIGYAYRLMVAAANADFAVETQTAEANLSRGGSVSVPVTVARRGFAGPLRLSAVGLPAGVTVQGGSVPAGSTVGVLTLSASPDASLPSPTSFTVEAVGKGEAGEMRRRAEAVAVLSRDSTATFPVLRLPALTLALTGPPPLTVRGPMSVEVVRGYPATVPITVTRVAGQPVQAVEVTGAVPVGAAGQQPPLTFKPATAAVGATTAAFTVTAAANAPVGQPFDLVPEGKARVGNADRTVTGPAVTVTVLPPFSVEVPPTLEVKAGGKATLSGAFKRHPLFKESVNLQIVGLPSGVAVVAPTAPIAADRNDFVMELRADANAAGRTGTALLTSTATINGTAYTHPAVPVSVKVLPVQ